MSRGPGKIQKTIIETIQKAKEPVQRNHLLWQIAKNTNRIKFDGLLCEEIRAGRIENSLISGYQRSLKTLSDSRQITITKRKLRDIDDFIDYYPYKTTSHEMLMLRKKLLPLIKPYLEKPHRKFPFTVRENEIYVLEKIISEHPTRYDRQSRHWRKIEKKILTQLSGKIKARKLWTGLLIKGRELFLDDRAEYGMAFHVIINKIEERKEKLVPTQLELLSEIQEFKQRVFKPDVMKHSRLKSQLGIVANFSERSRPYLEDETKQYFLREIPSLIKSLPEHEQPEQHSSGFYHRFPPRFDPILNKLIDRHAFSKFEFLTI